jgi:hypothetical protein
MYILESCRPKPERMKETLKGGQGPSWALAPLEGERERSLNIHPNNKSNFHIKISIK